MNPVELKLALDARALRVVFAEAGVEWVAAELRDLFPSRKPRVMLVTDERVALHYEQPLLRALQEFGFDVSRSILPPGEGEKRLARVAEIIDYMADHRFARDDMVLALGGGVVTDMAGFAAAIYRRGIPWVAAPTSLLAMVDAAIGGKTGVDHTLGKNLIGAFHQPLAVFAPLNVLATLDQREWLSGSAELVKAALLVGGELWEMVQRLGPDLNRWPREEVHRAVPLAASVKVDIVSQDERETGLRRLLNLGHTFGHALESVTGYARFKHGEAIFLGMRAAVRLSEAVNLLTAPAAAEMETVLDQADFPSADIPAELLVESLGHDKKVSGGKLHWVLLRGVGKPVVAMDVPIERVEEAAHWLAGELKEGQFAFARPRRLRVLVVNGPNLNLLGTREPEIYGSTSYAAFAAQLQEFAHQQGVNVLIRQSNLEGELVDFIQRARHWADGIIINPGGYTHTSVALRDAIASVTVPTIEVHLTDITQREEFRRTSLIAPVCAGHLLGAGLSGYQLAIKQLIDLNRDLGIAFGRKVS